MLYFIQASGFSFRPENQKTQTKNKNEKLETKKNKKLKNKA